MNESQDKRITGKYILAIILITIIAAALRLHQLDKHGLISNELFTVRDAMNMKGWLIVKSLSYLPTTISFYLCGVSYDQVDYNDYGSWKENGINEYKSRIGSCVIGIITIPVMGLVAVRFMGRHAAGILSVLLTLAIWHLEWSQNARFYVQWFMLFNLSYILYYTGMRSSSSIRIIMAVIFAILALMCQPIALMIFGIYAIDYLYVLVIERRVPAKLYHVFILASGFLLCVAILAYDVVSKTKGFSDFLEREGIHGPLRIVPENIFKVGLPVAILVVPAAYYMWKSNRRQLVFLVAGILVPVLCFTILAVKHVVHVRYTFVSLFPWLVLAAIALDRLYKVLRERMGVIAAYTPTAILIAFMLTVVFSYYHGGYGYRERYREAFEYVLKNRIDSDLVYSSNTPPAKYYLGTDRVIPMPSSFEEVERKGQSAWFIILADPSDTISQSRFGSKVQLKAVFTNRVLYPQVTVAVYYYHSMSIAKIDNIAFYQ